MRGSWLLAFAGLMLPSLALAQQASSPASPATASQDRPANPSDPIVVTARPQPSKDEIRSLARTITPRTFDEPLARFHDSVCFGTAGLDRRTLEDIGHRLALDAEQAGLDLAGDGCKPNVIILFVDGVDAQIRALVQRKWWVFGDRTPAEIRTVVNEKGPVRAWSNNEIRSRDGNRIEPTGVLKIETASRIVASIRRDTLASVVLIERSALVGKTTSQIGDYAAMRALAGARPQRTSGRDTILTLFDPATPTAPTELTAFDRGYLRGLYAGEANALASTTQGRIVREVLKAKAAESAQAVKN